MKTSVRLDTMEIFEDGECMYLGSAKDTLWTEYVKLVKTPIMSHRVVHDRRIGLAPQTRCETGYESNVELREGNTRRLNFSAPREHASRSYDLPAVRHGVNAKRRQRNERLPDKAAMCF